MTTSLANVMPKAAHVWRGGCSNRRHGGWHWFCLDRVTYDSAAVSEIQHCKMRGKRWSRAVGVIPSEGSPPTARHTMVGNGLEAFTLASHGGGLRRDGKSQRFMY